MIIMKAATGFNVYVCIHLWSRHRNLPKTPVTALVCLRRRPSCVFFFAFELLGCCGLSCRQGDLNPPPPLFLLSSLMQVVFSSPRAPSFLLWLAQTLHAHTVGHSPRAKGKHGGKVEGRPAARCHNSPGEESAGHSPGGFVGYPQSDCCLWRICCWSGLDCDLVI